MRFIVLVSLRFCAARRKGIVRRAQAEYCRSDGIIDCGKIPGKK